MISIFWCWIITKSAPFIMLNVLFIYKKVWLTEQLPVMVVKYFWKHPLCISDIMGFQRTTVNSEIMLILLIFCICFFFNIGVRECLHLFPSFPPIAAGEDQMCRFYFMITISFRPLKRVFQILALPRLQFITLLFWF